MASSDICVPSTKHDLVITFSLRYTFTFEFPHALRAFKFLELVRRSHHLH